jgi:hypothetical protein
VVYIGKVETGVNNINLPTYCLLSYLIAYLLTYYLIFYLPTIPTRTFYLHIIYLPSINPKSKLLMKLKQSSNKVGKESHNVKLQTYLICI